MMDAMAGHSSPAPPSPPSPAGRGPGWTRLLRGTARSAGRWWARWWHIVNLGALLLALLLSRGPWRHGAVRSAIGRHVWLSSAPLLASFGLGSALLAVVVTRIVLVTAQSYGLSQLALEMVVRVLVLELLPLGAALFVALRVALPAAVALAQMKADDSLEQLRRRGVDVLASEMLPRVCGSAFAVLLLVALNGVICLLVAYLLAHGLSPWGFDSFTRMVGRVFSPTVSLIFVLKTLAFAAAVAVVPVGSALHDPAQPTQDAFSDPTAAASHGAFTSASSRQPGRRLQSSVELSGLVRLFAALLVIEVLSLGINYG
jgi:phospholipid/cholesterol/gamma-HCH transport system permease protein